MNRNTKCSLCQFPRPLYVSNNNDTLSPLVQVYMSIMMYIVSVPQSVNEANGIKLKHAR